MKMNISWLIAIFVAILLFFFLFLVVLWKRKVAAFPSINSLPTIPVIGAPFYLKSDPHELFLQLLELSRVNDYLMVIWLFFSPVVLTSRLEYLEFVLSSPKHIRKSRLYDYICPWLGTGLLTSTGEKWKKRRRAITPSFHFGILSKFQDVFLDQTNIMISKLKHLANEGKPFDIQIPVSLATLDIICETAMGVSVNAQSDVNSPYVDAINQVNAEIQVRQLSPWLDNDFIYSLSGSGKRFYKSLKVLHDFTVSVINDRIAARKQNAKKNDEPVKQKLAFLDMLLDLYDKGEIDIDGIREEVDTFMFEGHDTTAAGLSWTLYCLGNNLDVQRKLHAAIDELDKEDGDLVEKIKSLKYLDYVIKEGLRLHPPVPYYARTLEEDTLIAGEKYPAGTEILLGAIDVHTNPAYWDEPLKFYPERFGEEKFLKRNPYVYIPFSAGPRNCVGQKFAMLEEKILLYHIMLNFEIRSTQKEEDVGSCFEIIHKSNNGLHVKVIPRKFSS